MKINMRENPMFTCIDIYLNIRSALFIIVHNICQTVPILQLIHILASVP